jgi:dTDP-4-amino-4,6-dideoxygalactose transaminase
LIPHSRPHVSEDDVQAVAQVVRRGQLAQGPEVEAFGRSQLRRLDAFIARRRAIAAEYRRRLAAVPGRPPADGGAAHVYHRFVVEVEVPVSGVLQALHDRRVMARRPVFRPLHRALGLPGYAEAERLWNTCVSVPCYPALTDEEVETVAAALVDVLGR